MMIIYQFLFLLLTYLIAAIPFGLILTKIFVKKDVRAFGSKNIGATNVTRIAGKKLGFFTLLLDGLKGAVMIVAARFNFYNLSDLHLFLVLVAAVAVLGHIYPVYLGFRGGKGVATTIAVLLALDFTVGFLAMCFWIITFCLFRISAIASLAAVFSSIITSFICNAVESQFLLCCFLFILILVRHKENLTQIIASINKTKKL
jgi:glycerol-3-phosphate acyltransferase PlsY